MNNNEFRIMLWIILSYTAIIFLLTIRLTSLDAVIYQDIVESENVVQGVKK